MRTFTIRDNRGLASCLYYLAELSEQDWPLEVICRNEQEGRRVIQNSLYWTWNTDIGNHMGLTKDEVHEMMKERFAVPIFTRDNPEYAAMVDAVKNVRRAGMGTDADHLKREIVRLTSTTDFTVKQMAEYLRDVEVFAGHEGANLTRKEDEYQRAMGRHKKKQEEP